MSKYFLAAIALFSAGLITWMSILNSQDRLTWDHFDAAKRGLIYRSGQLTAEQLTQAVERYKIRTVVSLHLPGKKVEDERALAKKLRIDFVNLPMPGDGFGEEPQFREFLKIADDPARTPLLVHCARGTCRTGSCVAMYRFERDGWTIEDVADEMRRQTYRDGWIPGYIYAMVKSKPPYTQTKLINYSDRNLPDAPPSDREGQAAPPSDQEGQVATHAH